MKTIPYSKFKHGQRVTCSIDEKKIDDARVSITRNGDVYVCQNIVEGFKAHDLFGYENSYLFLKKNEDYDEEKNDCKNLKFLPRTLDYLEEGDVLTTKNGVEKKVLGVCGQVYFLSMNKDFKTASSDVRTLEEIKQEGYTIKQEEPAEEITELTLEDVAKLANVSVEKLRIKD